MNGDDARNEKRRHTHAADLADDRERRMRQELLADDSDAAIDDSDDSGATV